MNYYYDCNRIRVVRNRTTRRDYMALKRLLCIVYFVFVQGIFDRRSVGQHQFATGDFRDVLVAESLMSFAVESFSALWMLH